MHQKKLSGGKIDCRMNKHKNNVVCKNKSKTLNKQKKSTKSKNSNLKLYKPVKSEKKDKKMKVLTKKGVIHFGQVNYEDFLMHKDNKRRKNYCTRSKGIRDGKGNLTYNNKESANYWSRTVLWKC